MNEENNIDKLFKEKLEGISETPPAFVWNGIKEKLADVRKKKRIAWYSWSAVAAMLLLAFIAGWYFNESSESIIPKTAEKEVEKVGGEAASGKTVMPTEPEGEEENEADKKQDADFMAEAAGFESLEGNSDKGNASSRAVVPSVLVSREKIKLPDRIQPIEAELQVQVRLQYEADEPEVERTAGLSSYEREIIERNVATNIDPVKEEYGWKMGVNVSPGYSSYDAKYGNSYASNMTQAGIDGNTNVSGGIAIRYRTAKRWSVESGIYYAQNGKQAGSSPQVFGGRAEAGYSTAPGRLYFNTAVKMETSGMAMNSVAGSIDIENLPAGAEIAADLENVGFYGNSLITQGEISQVFDLVEIPLYLRYLLVESKLDVELLGGINAGVIVSNDAFLDNQFGVQRIGKTNDISTMNISGTVGMGFSYALGDHFSLGLEPRFNYYMNSISRNPEVDFRPYRIGVYTGLYYSF